MHLTIDLRAQHTRDAADNDTAATAIVCAVMFLVFCGFMAYLLAHGAFNPALWAMEGN